MDRRYGIARLSRSALCAVILAAYSAACRDSSAPGSPTLRLVSTATRTAFANTGLADPVVVEVRNAKGLVIPNHPVSFAIHEGDGSLSGYDGALISDANGLVTAPAWRLGKRAIPQTLRASTSGVDLDISATVQTDYSIDVRFRTPLSETDKAVFRAAAGRVMGVVTGDLPNMPAFNLPMDHCGGTTFDEPVDDLVIFVSVSYIDGIGGTVGRGGPCWVRDQGNLPFVAVLTIDADDWASLVAEDQAEPLIVHEILHGVGFGSIWPLTDLVSDTGTTDPRYQGTDGKLGCLAVAGVAACDAGVPVEGKPAGLGARDAHWRESVFATEVMTGYGPFVAFSVVTVRSLADLGYTVNVEDADPFSLASIRLLTDGQPRVATEWRCADWPEIRKVDLKRNITRIRVP